MSDDEKITTYAEFWPHYLREHALPTTRALHYVGSLLGLAIAAWAVSSGRYALVPLALVPGYAFAWIGHFGFEKNRPATFTYPLWSFVSDWKMVACALTGRLGPELERAGARPRARRA